MKDENRLPKTVKDLAKWIVNIFTPTIVAAYEYKQTDFKIEVWCGVNLEFAQELQKELESQLGESFKDENTEDFFLVRCEQRGGGIIFVYLSRNDKIPEEK